MITSLNELPYFKSLDEYEHANEQHKISNNNSLTGVKNKRLRTLRCLKSNEIATNNNIKLSDPNYTFRDDMSLVTNPKTDNDPKYDTTNDMSFSFTSTNDRDANINFVHRRIILSELDNYENNNSSYIGNNNSDDDIFKDDNTNVGIGQKKHYPPSGEYIDNNDENDTISLPAFPTKIDTSIKQMLEDIPDGGENNIYLPIDDDIFKMEITDMYKSYIVIYEILSQAHVPLYMYDKIIKVILNEVRMDKLNPNTKFISRRTIFKWMEKTFKGLPKPLKTIIQLETPRIKLQKESYDKQESMNHRTKTEVITFDFEKQLIDLLNDKELFSNMDNLVINKDKHNPESKWLPYRGRSDKRIFETLDGDWYQSYAKKN